MALKINTDCMVADDVTIDAVPQAETTILSLPWRENVEVTATAPSAAASQTLLNALVRIYAVYFNGVKAEVGRGRAPGTFGGESISHGATKVIARANGHACDHYEITVTWGWEHAGPYDVGPAGRPIQFTASAWHGRSTTDKCLAVSEQPGWSAQSISRGSTLLYDLTAYNKGAVDGWLMLFDAAPETVLVNGQVPFVTLFLPANGNVGASYKAPLRFANGALWGINKSGNTWDATSNIIGDVYASYQ